MKRTRFTDEQIIGILREHEAGTPVSELCRKHGVSDASIYRWKAKFGGMFRNRICIETITTQAAASDCVFNVFFFSAKEWRPIKRNFSHYAIQFPAAQLPAEIARMKIV